MKYFILILGFVISINAASFKCPMFPFTEGTGEILLSEKYETPVPAGTNCPITFETDIGYAVKLTVRADLSEADSVTVIDSVRKVYQVSDDGMLIWLGNGFSTLNVSSTNGTLQFFASYDFIDLAKYTQTQLYAGNYFSANFNSSDFTYTTMTAINSSRIAISAVIQNYEEANLIYVYDGANIATSKMIGRLLDLFADTDRIYSTGYSISFVCFYTQMSDTQPILLANDADAVSNLAKYSVAVIPSMSLAGSLTDSEGSAQTFICDSCDTLYLDYLQFSDNCTTGTIELQGLTPTQKLSKLIRYDKATFESTQLPLIIPSKMFTMYYQNCSIDYSISANSSTLPSLYNMRSGVIISPNQWDPYQSSDFDYIFEDDTQLMNLNLDFGGVKLNDEKLLVQIAEQGKPCVNQTSTNGPCENIKYNKNQLPPKTMSIMGNYLRIALTGSSSTNSSTSVKIGFQFSNETISTTTVPPDSTVSDTTVVSISTVTPTTTGTTVTTKPTVPQPPPVTVVSTTVANTANTTTVPVTTTVPTTTSILTTTVVDTTTTSFPTTVETTPEPSSGLSTWAIVGISIGSVILAGGVIAAIFVAVKHFRKT